MVVQCGSENEEPPSIRDPAYFRIVDGRAIPLKRHRIPHFKRRKHVKMLSDQEMQWIEVTS
jgi:hypothetical protein